MWRKARVVVDDIGSDAVQGALLDCGALGLEIEDDETRAVPGEPFSPTGRALVIGTFSQREDLERSVVAALGSLSENIGFAFELEWSDLEPRDWNAEFKASWQPLQLCERAWIAPSWRADFEPPAGAICLRMDPGMAFGTGTHATTQLCAEALDAATQAGPVPSLLDVGTGTGVLSILALQLGVLRARGTDIEDAAVKAAHQNAKDNGVGDRFVVDTEPPDSGERFDAGVANILAGPLTQLAPAISRALKPGAPLWLSGLLEDQIPMLLRAYEAAGFREHGRAQRDKWVRLDMIRG